MQKIFFFFMFCFSLFLGASSQARALDFSTYSIGQGSPHILVIGGVQGDEPGGFSAASLLVTHYTINKGTVHIVPNLNFNSIIQKSRGIHGDMNRKFASISHDDPDYEEVKRIQKFITNPAIDMVLNLHDGSGYYHPEYISNMQNPNRWGQCVIIDQDHFDVPEFGNLEELAQDVISRVNTNLLDEKHTYHVKNTHTDVGNMEMAKSLTWFALGRGKPSFGLETSKELPVSERTFYHLNTIEAFFDIVGIEFERNFSLTTEGVVGVLSNDLYIGLAQNSVVIPLNDVRPVQAGFFPLPEWVGESVQTSSPILALQRAGNTMSVHYGNNHITSFKPTWYTMDYGINSVQVIVDNQKQTVDFGDIVYVKDSFYVLPMEGYRVNAIGAVLGEDESGIYIKHKDFMPHFSLDKGEVSFRVEVYKGQNYAGTFVVTFDKDFPEEDSTDTVFTPFPTITLNKSELSQ